MTKRRGRERKSDYITTWGEKIEGAYLSPDGRLRPIGKSSPAFGGDEAEAVMKFKAWKRAQAPGVLPPSDVDDLVMMGTSAYSIAHDPEALLSNPEIKAVFVEYFRKLIMTNPPQAALELRVPHLAVHPVMPQRPEFTLAELGQHYLDNKRNQDGKPLHPKYRENTERAWNEFVKSVGVTYAREITQAMILDYMQPIMRSFDKGKSPAWVRTRFTAVKTILKHGLDYSRDKADYRAALDQCGILKSPADRVDPKPISVDHFHLLLDNASEREAAMLLMGLNMAGHPGEVCAVKKSECDLDKGTLACRRSKNGYPRVAKLWPRVVDAIHAYLKANPHKSDSLFISNTGAAMTAENLRQRIVAIRDKVNTDHQEKTKTKEILIPDTVTFDGLRDAAFGAAEQCDHHHAKFVAGHKTGMSDKYVLRQADNPKVVECCQAIEDHFFPKGKTKKGGKK